MGGMFIMEYWAALRQLLNQRSILKHLILYIPFFTFDLTVADYQIHSHSIHQVHFS